MSGADSKPACNLHLLLVEESATGDDATVWEMDYEGFALPGDPRHEPEKLHAWLASHSMESPPTKTENQTPSPQNTDELSKTREALQASEHQLAGIIESAMDAMLCVNDQQRIVLFNPAAEKMFRRAAADAVGRHLNELIPQRFRSAHTAQVRSFAETAETTRHMGGQNCLLALRADGTEFPAEISISQSEVKGRKFFTAIVRDITERKKAEEGLARKTEELERSNQDLEQFAYVASHDLQEPLRMVSAYTQLLADRYRGRLDPSADQYIAYAVDGAIRMQALIQDLLAFSRVGRLPRERQTIDCGSVIDEVAKNLLTSISECGAVLNYGKLPLISADRLQMVQLFQNLISNAIKFRGENTPVISISAEKQRQDWIFAVADNGIGVAAEHRERIFEIFQRLHSRQKYPGNGMGLSICKKIVEQHGGRIWVESENRQGSTFKFVLPAVQLVTSIREWSQPAHAGA